MIPHIFAPNERDAETAESWQEFQIIDSWYTNQPPCGRIGFESQDAPRSITNARTGRDLNHVKRPKQHEGAGHETGECAAQQCPCHLYLVICDSIASSCCLQAIHRCPTGASASIEAPQVHPVWMCAETEARR